MTEAKAAILIPKGHVDWHCKSMIGFCLVLLENEGLNGMQSRFVELFMSKKLAMLDFSSTAMFLISRSTVGSLCRHMRFGQQVTTAQHSCQCIITTMDVLSLA